MILYSAEWCGPCKNLKLLMKTLDLEATVIDIDKEPEAAKAAGIRGIPCLVAPSGARRVGALHKDELLSFFGKE